MLLFFSGDPFIESRVDAIISSWFLDFPNGIIFADTTRTITHLDKNNVTHEITIEKCCPQPIYTNLALTQYKWKYVPIKLFEKFPQAQYYLLVDDDSYVYKKGLMKLINDGGIPSPEENAVVVSKFAAFSKPWSERRCRKVSESIFDTPENVGCLDTDFILIPGGIMMFTHEGLRKMANPFLITQCIDDLAVMDARGHYPYGGRYKMEKEGKKAYYNQDHLFSWCIQGRSRGKVIRSTSFYFYGGNKWHGFQANVLVDHFFKTDLKTSECDESDWWETGLSAVHQLKDPWLLNWIRQECFEKENSLYEDVSELEFGVRVSWNTTTGKKLDKNRFRKKNNETKPKAHTKK